MEVRRPNLTLEGETAESVRIVGGLGAFMENDAGEKLGTFRTYTMLVDADDVTLRNLAIENDAGDGRRVGQGVALYVDGDRLVVDACRILGHQDTLFCGPLPPREVVPGGFAGPKQFAPRIVGRQYYRRCLIAGDVDFVFGGARAYFEGCELRSLDRGEEVNGYVTAASTPEGGALRLCVSRLLVHGRPPGRNRVPGAPVARLGPDRAYRLLAGRPREGFRLVRLEQARRAHALPVRRRRPCGPGRAHGFVGALGAPARGLPRPWACRFWSGPRSSRA